MTIHIAILARVTVTGVVAPDSLREEDQSAPVAVARWRLPRRGWRW